MYLAKTYSEHVSGIIAQLSVIPNEVGTSVVARKLKHCTSQTNVRHTFVDCVRGYPNGIRNAKDSVVREHNCGGRREDWTQIHVQIAAACKEKNNNAPNQKMPTHVYNPPQSKP